MNHYYPGKKKQILYVVDENIVNCKMLCEFTFINMLCESIQLSHNLFFFLLKGYPITSKTFLPKNVKDRMINFVCWSLLLGTLNYVLAFTSWNFARCWSVNLVISMNHKALFGCFPFTTKTPSVTLFCSCI